VYGFGAAKPSYPTHLNITQSAQKPALQLLPLLPLPLLPLVVRFSALCSLRQGLEPLRPLLLPPQNALVKMKKMKNFAKFRQLTLSISP